MYPHIFLKIGRNKYADLLKIRTLQITITCFGEGHREVSKLYAEISSTSAWLNLTNVKLTNVVGDSGQTIMLRRENNLKSFVARLYVII